MSGIVALLGLDGARVDPTLTRRLTASLASRGPDEQRVWCDGRVAFGHALLRTTNESVDDEQPLSLNGEVWITADARVDGRADLVRTLGGGATMDQTPDAELILRSYLRWGDACVEHLLGDFAFVIWDRPRRRLFCARDHMGVKPFYYASVDGWLLISNTIETLRRHPSVSARLNDQAIADFLLCGFNQDAATTSFHDIYRLPAAHTLTWSAEAGRKTHRYWTLPIEEPLYLGRDIEYIDRYNDLITQAVSDRLRTDHVNIFMSGGLDSTGLAAAALKVLGSSKKHDSVRAYTFVFNSLMPDSEREYAGIAARHLGIPICFYELDTVPGWVPSVASGTPEPVTTLTDAEPERRCYADMVRHSRVCLFGEGPDNALQYEWRPYVAYLVRRNRWMRLLGDVAKHVISHKRVPLLPTIPRMLRDRRKWKHSAPLFPKWIASEMVDRLDLRARWHEIYAPRTSSHPVRLSGYASLVTNQWQHMFESLEPAYTGVALEMRHPYVDVRLLSFLLRVPALPWCRAKYIQREALRAVLPIRLLNRPKTPLAANPDYERFRQFGMPSIRSSPLLAAYGDVRCLEYPDKHTSATVDAALRLIALSHWLSGVHSQSQSKEVTDGIKQASRGIPTPKGDLREAGISHLR